MPHPCLGKGKIVFHYKIVFSLYFIQNVSSKFTSNLSMIFIQKRLGTQFIQSQPLHIHILLIYIRFVSGSIYFKPLTPIVYYLRVVYVWTKYTLPEESSELI